MTKADRISAFRNAVAACVEDNSLKVTLIEKVLPWLKENEFFDAPASTRFHGAYPGGLFDHSYAVTKRLIELTNNCKLKWERKESPFIVGMFHDLCKFDCYVRTDEYEGDPIKYKHNESMVLEGHGAKSVMLLAQFFPLTEEEILCIRYHMGAYEKDDWNGFDKAIKRYETVLYTHTADQLASKVDSI